MILRVLFSLFYKTSNVPDGGDSIILGSEGKIVWSSGWLISSMNEKYKNFFF